MNCWELTEDLRKRSRGFFEFIMPAIDMFEEGNEIVVKIDLPGFVKENISLKIIGDILTITARRKEEKELYYGTRYYMQRPLQLNRKVVLPISTKDGEAVIATARYESGVVTLRIPIPRSAYIPID